jgi:hypothetical protein
MFAKVFAPEDFNSVVDEHCSKRDRLSPAVVASLVAPKEWRKIPAAVEAVREEARKFERFKVWDLKEVREKSAVMAQARKEQKEVNFGFIFSICSRKHSEDPSRAMWKGRLVFSGHRITDQVHAQTFFNDVSSAPVSMAACRAFVLAGMRKGYTTRVADVTAAYLQANMDLPRDVVTWAELPAELVPPEWAHMKTPVVPLRKAVYGHPMSGLLWERRLEKVLFAQGWSCIEGWPSAYVHKASGCCMAIYVDDIICSGPERAVKERLQALRSEIIMDEDTPLQRYLGCEYVVTKERGKTRLLTQMKAFLQQCLERYDLAVDSAIKKHGSTPHLVSLQKRAGADTPFLPDQRPLYNQELAEGALKNDASSLLMKLLYACRLARPDLLKATTTLAQFVTRWSVAHDLATRRLFAYVSSTLDLALVGEVADEDKLEQHVYADSDFASCLDTRRSTTGVWQEAITYCGDSPCSFPLTWTSSRQNAISYSTPEAEIVAACHATNKHFLPMMTLLEHLLGRSNFAKVAFQDNTVAEKSLSDGKSSFACNLARTHDVSLKSVAEVIQREGIQVRRAETSAMKADVFTKAFGSLSKWKQAVDHIGLVKVQ